MLRKCSSSFTLGYGSAEAKVTDFDVAVVVNQDVVWVQIPMHDATAVDEVECTHQVVADSIYVFGSEVQYLCRLYYLLHIWLHILHDNVYIYHFWVRLINDNIDQLWHSSYTFQLLQTCQFLHDMQFSWDLNQLIGILIWGWDVLQHLNGICLSGSLALCFDYSTKASLTDLFDELVPLRDRVTLGLSFLRQGLHWILALWAGIRRVRFNFYFHIKGRTGKFLTIFSVVWFDNFLKPI